MSKLIKSPKPLTILIVMGVVFLGSIAGGALGNEFGGGFLGSPLAHIQLSAESLTSDALFLDFKITNTMAATWAAIIVLISGSFFVGRRMREVPGRLQGIAEVIIEFFLNLTENMAGPERGRRFFPLVMTIFRFIVAANWIGILPGFGTIGRVETVDEIVHHLEDRGDEVDLNEIKLQVFDGDGGFAIMPFGSIDDKITAAELEVEP